MEEGNETGPGPEEEEEQIEEGDMKLLGKTGRLLGLAQNAHGRDTAINTIAGDVDKMSDWSAGVDTDLKRYAEENTELKSVISQMVARIAQMEMILFGSTEKGKALSTVKDAPKRGIIPEINALKEFESKVWDVSTGHDVSKGNETGPGPEDLTDPGEGVGGVFQEQIRKITDQVLDHDKAIPQMTGWINDDRNRLVIVEQKANALQKIDRVQETSLIELDKERQVQHRWLSDQRHRILESKGDINTLNGQVERLITESDGTLAFTRATRKRVADLEANAREIGTEKILEERARFEAAEEGFKDAGKAGRNLRAILIKLDEGEAVDESEWEKGMGVFNQTQGALDRQVKRREAEIAGFKLHDFQLAVNNHTRRTYEGDKCIEIREAPYSTVSIKMVVDMGGKWGKVRINISEKRDRDDPKGPIIEPMSSD